MRSPHPTFRLRRPWLWVVAALLVAVPALAQRGAIRGKIVDPDGNPLEGVSVQIVLLDGGGRPINVTTNSNGEFTRAGLRVQNYRVSLELDGYEPLQAMVQVSNGGQARINETMTPLPEGVLTAVQAAEADNYLRIAQDAFDSGEWDVAVEAFRGFIGLQPQAGPAWFNLAAALERSGDHDGAIEAYEKAVELAPDLDEGLLAVADLHGQAQRWDEALTAFDRAMHFVETSAMNLFNYAVYASNAGRQEVADAFFVKATEVDPNFAPAYLQVGMTRARLEDREGAIAAFERYLELEPDGAQAVSVREILDSLRHPGPD